MGVQPLPGNKQQQSLGTHASSTVTPPTSGVGGASTATGFGGKGQSATEQLVQMQDRPAEKERDATQNLG